MGMTRSSDDMNRLVRHGRWLGILIGALVCLTSAGQHLSGWAWPVAGLIALSVFNVVQARWEQTRNPVLKRRGWLMFSVGLDTATVAAHVAVFSADASQGLWAVFTFPVMHAALRFGFRGSLGMWLCAVLFLVGLEMVQQRDTPAGTDLGAVTYQSLVLLLLAWALGHLATRLNDRVTSVGNLRLVAQTTQRLAGLEPLDIMALVRDTARAFGVDEVDVVWRMAPCPSWNGGTRLARKVNQQRWADEVVANLGHYRSMARLHSLEGSDLVCNPRGADGPIVVAGRLDDDIKLLIVASVRRPLDAHAAGSLEVLFHHAAERLISCDLKMQAARREQHLTEHDLLTKLPNRARVTHEIDTVISQSTVSQNLTGRDDLTAILLFDLDRFKEINDTLGHEHGDQLLVRVAERMQRILREGDVLARLGGDEFVVVARAVHDPGQAVRAAERIMAEVNKPLLIDGIAITVESSVGIALVPEHGVSAYDLLRCADIAMYEAKRNQLGIAVYDSAADRNSPDRLTLLSDLRTALSTDDQLHLHFQPMIDISTGRVVAAEALMRWTHPKRGMVMPGDFIPLAESTGLIHPMTIYVLDRALKQLSQWQAMGLDMSVAVNISTRSLLDPEFPEMVRDAISRYGADPHRLRLEITESTIMADPNKAVATLKELSQHGIKLSIDDFGTGYSSLSYLKQLPVDELKVDRSFVMDLMNDEEDAVLVRAVVDLGHNLGLHVVAEGVENEETLATLNLIGCDVAQGFHLSRPIPAAHATAWIQDWNNKIPHARRASDRDRTVNESVRHAALTSSE